MPDENARHAKVESKRKAFCLPSRSYHSPLPITHTHTHTQARRLSQKVPDKMQLAAVSGEETEREKTEGDWFDSLARRCVGVSAPGTQAEGRGAGGVASPA